MPFHCFLASVVSDEKPAINFIVVPLYMMSSFFSCCFQDFLFVFGFQLFGF